MTTRLIDARPDEVTVEGDVLYLNRTSGAGDRVLLALSQVVAWVEQDDGTLRIVLVEGTEVRVTPDPNLAPDERWLVGDAVRSALFDRCSGRDRPRS
jgi:hypothetical protein